MASPAGEFVIQKFREAIEAGERYKVGHVRVPPEIRIHDYKTAGKGFYAVAVEEFDLTKVGKSA